MTGNFSAWPSVWLATALLLTANKWVRYIMIIYYSNKIEDAEELKKIFNKGKWWVQLLTTLAIVSLVTCQLYYGVQACGNYATENDYANFTSKVM
jgi:hypothetical protein